jgi:tetratricopeptide (TPR) repeat protein
MSPALQLRLPLVARLCVLAGLLPIACAPASAQQQPPTEMGRIHGHVINPTGVPQQFGTVSLSTDGGASLSYTFPVSAAGDYSGQAPVGEYTVVYRAPDTPEGKIVDYINEVEVVAGQDTSQDIDMTRQAFIDRLSPEQQRQLQEMKAANAAALAGNHNVTAFDADLQAVKQDFQDAVNARAAATQALGASASQADINARTDEIASAKYTEIETLMTRETAANSGEPALWIYLARAQTGLKNYLDAETNFKKALDLESKAERPDPQILGAADAGLGEVYARTLMIDDANAAFDAAAKADPPNAANYLRDQALVFFQERDFPAQVDAADEALSVDPNEAILYYIKAAGLAENARVDPNTNRIVLPPGCADAYRKYLELAPNGPYASQVTVILMRAGESIRSSSAPPAK